MGKVFAFSVIATIDLKTSQKARREPEEPQEVGRGGIVRVEKVFAITPKPGHLLTCITSCIALDQPNSFVEVNGAIQICEELFVPNGVQCVRISVGE